MIKVLKTNKQQVKQKTKNKINRASLILHTVRKMTMNKKKNRASGWVSAKTVSVVISENGLELSQNFIMNNLNLFSGRTGRILTDGSIKFKNILNAKQIDGIWHFQYNPKGIQEYSIHVLYVYKWRLDY